MANHFSALKRARQTTKRTATNRSNTSRLRTALRTLRETIEKGDKTAAEKTYRETVSALDKGNSKGHAARKYGVPLQIAAGQARYLYEVEASFWLSTLSSRNRRGRPSNGSAFGFCKLNCGIHPVLGRLEGKS